MSTPGNQPASTISGIGERGLIERIRRRVPAAPAALVVGIGDDAAVTRPGRGTLDVLTTDVLVEGVHFDRRFSSLSDVGYKALAVNVSDVAAMGGTPRLALLSLILPDSTTVGDVDALLDGLLVLASERHVFLAGGNISRSPGPLVVDLSLVGSVRPRRILTRGGGRPGDELYVTGTVGAAAAGLEWLREHAGGEPPGGAIAECIARYRRPEPRARVGSLLGRNRAASACMDLSDGLADAVRQLAEASGTGATIDASLLPVHPGAREYWSRRGVGDPPFPAIAGGDDYELLFSVPRKSRGRLRHVRQQARGIPVTRIGRLTAEAEVVLVTGGRTMPMPEGFLHFQTQP